MKGEGKRRVETEGGNPTSKKSEVLSRKLLRKEKRLCKKRRKAEWYRNGFIKSEHQAGTAVNVSHDDEIKQKNGKRPRKVPFDTMRACGISFTNEELSITSGNVPATSNEDAELIKYLEGKLGLKDTNDARKLREKVAAEDFGGDSSLLDMAWALADGEAVTAADNGQGIFRADDQKIVYEGYSSRGSTTEGVLSDDDSGAESPSDETEEATFAPKSSPSIYVPPHLRSKASIGLSAITSTSTDPERLLTQVIDEIAPQIRSLFNRVSEGNLNLLLGEIVKAMATGKEKLIHGLNGHQSIHFVHRLIEEISEVLVQVAISFLELKAGANLTAPQTAMLCGLSGVVSPKILVLYTTRCLALYEKSSLEIFKSLSDDSTERVLHTAFDTSLDQVDLCRQTINSLCMLFYFGLMNVSLFAAFLQHLAAAQAEESIAAKTRRLDFLALVLRLTAIELKTRNPEEYKGFTTTLTTMLTSLDGIQNMHVDFLRHELENVGRVKKAPIYEKLVAMKNWLIAKGGAFREVNWDNVQIDSHNPTRSLHQMLQGEVPSDLVISGDVTPDLKSSEDSKGNTDLLRIAKSLNIKAPLQQQAFIAMSSADSVHDAATRLISLIRKRKQLPFLVAVILYCAVQEKSYNLFYEELCLQLCQSSEPQTATRFRRAFRQGLHSLVGGLDASSSSLDKRKKLVAAKLTCRMIQERMLSPKDSLLEKYK